MTPDLGTTIAAVMIEAGQDTWDPPLMPTPELADIERRIACATDELRAQQALVLINADRGRKADFARLLSHSLRQFRMLEVLRMTAFDDAGRTFERDAQHVFQKACGPAPLSNDTRDDA